MRVETNCYQKEPGVSDPDIWGRQTRHAELKVAEPLRRARRAVRACTRPGWRSAQIQRAMDYALKLATRGAIGASNAAAAGDSKLRLVPPSASRPSDQALVCTSR